MGDHLADFLDLGQRLPGRGYTTISTMIQLLATADPGCCQGLQQPHCKVDKVAPTSITLSQDVSITDQQTRSNENDGTIGIQWKVLNANGDWKLTTGLTYTWTTTAHATVGPQTVSCGQRALGYLQIVTTTTHEENYVGGPAAPGHFVRDRVLKAPTIKVTPILNTGDLFDPCLWKVTTPGSPCPALPAPVCGVQDTD